MGGKQETLATYVGDMHALEEHMLKAFEHQLELSKDTPEAHKVVQELVRSCRARDKALEQCLKLLDVPSKDLSDTIKSAVAGLFGMAAGVIDKVRPQQVSKALRDSYTALNLAIISYVMLDTTAQALQDQETARLAQQHLQDCLTNAQAVARVIPTLVVSDLSDDVQVPGTTVSSVINNSQFANLYGTKAQSKNA